MLCRTGHTTLQQLEEKNSGRCPQKVAARQRIYAKHLAKLIRPSTPENISENCLSRPKQNPCSGESSILYSSLETVLQVGTLVVAELTVIVGTEPFYASGMSSKVWGLGCPVLRFGFCQHGGPLSEAPSNNRFLHRGFGASNLRIYFLRPKRSTRRSSKQKIVISSSRRCSTTSRCSHR